MIANVKSLVVVAGIFIVDEPYVTYKVEKKQRGLVQADVDEPGQTSTGLCTLLTASAWPLRPPGLTQPPQQQPSKLLPSVCPSVHLPNSSCPSHTARSLGSPHLKMFALSMAEDQK